jgi:transcription elongation GreA/GreB family factor
MDARMVHLGSRVRIRDADGEAEFWIVPPEDADVAQERVSAESPLGRALLGRRLGDEVRYRAPGGVLVVTIVGVTDVREPAA